MHHRAKSIFVVEYLREYKSTFKTHESVDHFYTIQYDISRMVEYRYTLKENFSRKRFWDYHFKW
jgi:hypothetical protein